MVAVPADIPVTSPVFTPEVMAVAVVSGVLLQVPPPSASFSVIVLTKPPLAQTVEGPVIADGV